MEGFSDMPAYACCPSSNAPSTPTVNDPTHCIYEYVFATCFTVRGIMPPTYITPINMILIQLTISISNICLPRPWEEDRVCGMK